MKIKDKIKQSKIMYYPLLIKRCIQDDGLKQWIQDYKSNYSLIFRKNGDKYPDINIYYMRFSDETMGFFAYWKYTIIELDYAEKFSLIPVVDWTQNSPYYEPNKFGINSNPFEYYFEPVSDISVADVQECSQVNYGRLSLDITDKFKKQLDYDYQNMVDDYVKYNRKYIKVKPEIKQQLEKEISELFCNQKVIGVHIRGVEWGNILGHPIPVSVDEYLETVKIYVEKEGYQKVFVATDSEEALQRAKKFFGSKIVYFDDVLRTAAGSKTLMLFDNSVNRVDNHFKMGYEVLRDMLALSYCDSLVAGFSNISLAARVFKESRNEKYLHFEILHSLKICTKGISSQKAVKMMKKGKY